MNLAQVIRADGGDMEPGTQILCVSIILILLVVGLILHYKGPGRPKR